MDMKYIPALTYLNLKMRLEDRLYGTRLKRALSMLDELMYEGRTESTDNGMKISVAFEVDDGICFITDFTDGSSEVEDATEDGMAMSLVFAV